MNRDRIPRTLEEAFGPYQRGPVQEPDPIQTPPSRWEVMAWAAYFFAIALGVVSIIVIVTKEAIP